MDKVSPVNGQPLPDRRIQAGEEAREIGRKGGIASGESRRRRKLIRETIEEVLSTEVKAKDGNTATTQDLLVASVVAKAIDSGNFRALESLAELLGEGNGAKEDNGILDVLIKGLKDG